jgi:hypothetical protein
MPAWIKANDRTYLATSQKPNGTCHHLTVEKMDGEDRLWNWFTWRAGTSKGEAYYGHARCVLDAMKAAERTVSHSCSGAQS